MKRVSSLNLLAGALALGLATVSTAEEVVFEFKGSASRNTPEFEVEAPWILDWRITTEGAYESAVEISLTEAGTGVHQGRVLTTKFPGNGVRMFDQGGRYYFRVDSAFSNWTLKVIQLTDQEAEQYTRRERPSAID